MRLGKGSFAAVLAATALMASACGGSSASSTTAAAQAGSGGAGHLDKVTLTLNWYPYGEHAGLYYGQKEGIFKQHGIDLTIRPGQGSGKTVQAVGAGHTDFGWADTPAVLAGVQSGLPVKDLGAFIQTTPSAVQFFASENIHSPADLKGKTIASTAGDALTATFPAFLKANGLSMSDVKIQNVDAAGKIAALISGKVDALLGFMTDQGPTIENKSGKQVDYLPFAQYGLNYFSTGLLTSDQMIKDNPDLVKRMVEATSQSYAEAAKHQDQAVADMAGASEQLPPASVLKGQFAKTVERLHTDASKGMPPGANVESDWKHTIQVFADSGMLKNPGPPSTYWASQFTPKG